MSTKAKALKTRPLTLCSQPTSDGPCWRLQDHHGKHVNQNYMVPAERPLAVVSHDGVLVAMYRAFQLAAAQQYIRHSGGHAVDVKTWEVKS